jgi:Ca2+/Na+ antiporter
MNWIKVGWSYVVDTAKNLFTKAGMTERDAVIRASVYFAAAFVFTLVTFPGLQQFYAFLIALVFITMIHVVMIWLTLKNVTLVQGPERDRPSAKPELVTR